MLDATDSESLTFPVLPRCESLESMFPGDFTVEGVEPDRVRRRCERKEAHTGPHRSGRLQWNATSKWGPAETEQPTPPDRAPLPPFVRAWRNGRWTPRMVGPERRVLHVSDGSYDSDADPDAPPPAEGVYESDVWWRAEVDAEQPDPVPLPEPDGWLYLGGNIYRESEVRAYADARARHAVQRERERVVRWLRENLGDHTEDTYFGGCDECNRGYPIGQKRPVEDWSGHIADFIERGDHEEPNSE